jgi:hypothetical protein
MDISHILRDWPFEPGQVTVRRVKGDDGRDKIQMRLDLGLLQMEAFGRPDGQQPHGVESLLDYHQQQLEQYRQEHGSEEGFHLDGHECQLLRAESLLYYHRYVAQFVLEDFDAVERDTTRNLRVMDFCAAYARENSDRYQLEQYRPYVLMMRTRAICQRHLRDKRLRAALAEVHRGIGEIQDFFRGIGQDKIIESSGEISVLKALAHEIRAEIPVDPVNHLKHALAKAVAEERYEEAASLRDQIRKAAEDSSPPSGEAAPPTSEEKG